MCTFIGIRLIENLNDTLRHFGLRFGAVRLVGFGSIFVVHLDGVTVVLGPPLVSLIPLFFRILGRLFVADENILKQIHLGTPFVFKTVLRELLAHISGQLIVGIDVFEGVTSLLKLFRRGSVLTQAHDLPSHVRLVVQLDLRALRHVLVDFRRAGEISLHILVLLGIKA